ncbi:MAG TPA: hypothetical protein P5026_11580 [Kiritimatiellia bacterium]|nr:hypothetical protein [Kiritimatiellia bacterium]HRU71506.1 hypothetical protein [Kiritimatiellia bacterium]
MKAKPSKPTRLAAKRKKAAGKRARLAARLKENKMNHTAITATVMPAIAAALLLAGCQTADPASRSNRTSYRDIRAEVNGCSNIVRITVGDGLYASADGGAALDKLMSIISGTAPAGTKLTAAEAAAITDCVGGACEPAVPSQTAGTR